MKPLLRLIDTLPRKSLLVACLLILVLGYLISQVQSIRTESEVIKIEIQMRDNDKAIKGQ